MSWLPEKLPHAVWIVIAGLTLAMAAVGTAAVEAPAGFDNKSNGVVDDATHAADQAKFEEVEGVADGLGPLYNAQSCRECHQNPTTGGMSQIAELRVGHLGPDGKFRNPEIPINRGGEIIKGRTLVNDRAICPSGAFPDVEIQERVPEKDTIRTTRMALNLLGDGYIEALTDDSLKELAREQCKTSGGKICGLAIYVPVVEARGGAAIGRFGWKDQHASLLSFSGDAYLNEMGITNTLFPDEVTKLCNTVPEPNDTPGADGLSDIDHFARFVRASKPPARDAKLAETAKAKKGSELFDKIGCAVCHVGTFVTPVAGTKVNAGMFTVPAALGSKTFHPYSDFLLHDVKTGDGIVIPIVEHYGRAAGRMPKECSSGEFEKTRNRVRTAPLWGVRLRTRLMHDGVSLTFEDAIRRHRGEAEVASEKFRRLGREEREEVLEFLRSL